MTVGERFCRVVVLKEYTKKGDTRKTCYCKCDCGNYFETQKLNLTSGDTKSCGCLKDELTAEMFRSEKWDRIREQNKDKQFKYGTNLHSLQKETESEDTITGRKGVRVARNKYQPYITFRNKDYYLGAYETFEEAEEIRIKAEDILHQPALEDRIDDIKDFENSEGLKLYITSKELDRSYEDLKHNYIRVTEAAKVYKVKVVTLKKHVETENVDHFYNFNVLYINKKWLDTNKKRR